MTQSPSPQSSPRLLFRFTLALLSACLLLVGACSDEFGLGFGDGGAAPRIPYRGPITVLNRSQFTYKGFYMHESATPSMFENLLEAPLQRGDSVQVEVRPRLYFSASRPKVERGREWLIQTASPVTFYGNRPTLLILDQGFMVIDPYFPPRVDEGPPLSMDQSADLDRGNVRDQRLDLSLDQSLDQALGSPLDQRHSPALDQGLDLSLDEKLDAMKEGVDRGLDAGDHAQLDQRAPLDRQGHHDQRAALDSELVDQ
ncbi:MAG: hypothetical protein VYD19_01320 [Myxococcota bacterium]|nr:hypothetical protein [Myxococcota bacterium]